MSGTYVTEDGFVGLTYEENKTYWETAFQTIFGASIDLDPEGPAGQLIGILAKRDTDLWEALAEIYNSRDPDQAVGVALDAICAETGVIRTSEGSTTVESVQLDGDIGTLIPAGSQVRQSEGENTDINYSLLSDVYITQNSCRKVILTVGTPVDAEVFRITLDGTAYEYTASVGTDDDEYVATQLKALIEAGDFGGTVTQDGAELTIEYLNTDFSMVITTNITLDFIAVAGSFQADTAGTYTVPVGTLDTIVTPVSGWDAVYNPVEGTAGRERETDIELRIRRANTLTTGNATEDALVANVSNNAANVTRVAIQSNRTDVTDGDGLPPHSFELVVSGGIAQDIVDEIWATQAAGIASYGTESGTITDSNGDSQTVYFSRPTPKYAWVKVKRDLYSEEDYPADGDTQIKKAIVAWAAINQPIGKDIIRQRLSIPVYEVPGIEDIEITIAVTDNPGDTPTYVSTSIAIAAREYAEFDISRITVEDLTP